MPTPGEHRFRHRVRAGYLRSGPRTLRRVDVERRHGHLGRPKQASFDAPRDARRAFPAAAACRTGDGANALRYPPLHRSVSLVSEGEVGTVEPAVARF